MPRCHHEFFGCQIGVDFDIREIYRVVPRRAVVPHADGISATKSDERETDCVLIGGGNLGVIVDDQCDKRITTEGRGIERVRRRETSVRNGFAAGADGKVFHWIDLGRLTEGFYDTRPQRSGR